MSFRAMIYIVNCGYSGVNCLFVCLQQTFIFFVYVLLFCSLCCIPFSLVGFLFGLFVCVFDYLLACLCFFVSFSLFPAFFLI